MKRVLLVCPEPLGHRQPAGVGIRFLEFARQLISAGHAVEILTPDGAPVEGCVSGTITAETIHTASARSDVAVVQGHVANDFFAHSDGVPTVVDLYDPFIIENLHYSRRSTDEVFQHDHSTLMRSLSRGDFFLCASETQRMFYLGLLLASGRVNPERFSADSSLQSLIAIAPFGVPPRRTISPRHSRAILFGGIYDWYEPQIAIDTVALLRSSFPDVTLTFNRHPNAASTPQSKAAAAERYAESNGYGSFVRFEPWTPYADRIDYYESFALALLTFPQSLETDLSMRTRIYDYLWAGLPVVTSSAGGTDEILERHAAGVVVHSNDPERFAESIAPLLQSEEKRAAMAAGADEFVKANQWPDVLAPLLRFCANPQTDSSKKNLSAEASLAHPLPPRTLVSRIRSRLGRLRRS